MTGNHQLAFHALGDHGVVVHLGEQISDDVFERVQAFSRALTSSPLAGVIEHVPAYTTITLYYDPGRTCYDDVCQGVKQIVLPDKEGPPSTTVDIPVCYGAEFGVDLEHVAQHNRLTVEEVIAIHSSASYRVHMLGFAPGFPYLGGMSKEIATPRRSTPRLKVPAGSVGIAGAQTGIYPLETPGGWQIIGRTPLAIFKPDDDPPTLLTPGDMVRFRPITRDEYAAQQEAIA